MTDERPDDPTRQTTNQGDSMTTTYPDLANPYTLWVAAYDLLSEGR